MAASGIVIVDKPVGPTSFDVVARVRRVMGTREVGHCGTLDPLASGVVVVCVGSWTRLVRVLEADDKRYIALIAFGTSTTTDDAEGDVVERGDASGLTREAIERALPALTGHVQQVPPAYSAIHVDGERAYAKARRGEAVQMKPRDVVIHALALDWPEERDVSGVQVQLRVHCGKGTYIRSLARDLGRTVGVPAHLAGLRRTHSGAYSLDDAVKLDELTASSLRTDLASIRGIARVAVDAAGAAALRQGKRVPTEVSAAGTLLAHEGERPVALVHVDDGRLVVERGFG